MVGSGVVRASLFTNSTGFDAPECLIGAYQRHLKPSPNVRIRDKSTEIPNALTSQPDWTRSLAFLTL